MRRLIAEAFRDGLVELTLTVTRDDSGQELIRCTWAAGLWEGLVELRKPASRELTAKDVGGVLKLLQQAKGD